MPLPFSFFIVFFSVVFPGLCFVDQTNGWTDHELDAAQDEKVHSPSLYGAGEVKEYASYEEP